MGEWQKLDLGVDRMVGWDGKKKKTVFVPIQVCGFRDRVKKRVKSKGSSGE